MKIIDGKNLKFEYVKWNEEGQVESSMKAVDGVDLDIEAGDFIAVLGHNGSGKSTLAKHINAILLPTEGSLYVDGKDTRSGRRLVWFSKIRTIRLSGPLWMKMWALDRKIWAFPRKKSGVGWKRV